MSTHTHPIAPLTVPFSGSLTMPGSKSIANRAIVAACLSEGETIIQNATPCDDVVLMVENLGKMGFDISWVDKEKGEIKIVGGIPASSSNDVIRLSCENAGTTVRFLTSLACIVPGEWEMTGNEHMLKRPIGNLVETLRSLGAEIDATNGCPPIRIKGGTLKGGSAIMDASKSSQFLSSLLLVGPMLPQGLSLTLASTLASPSYIELTKNIIQTFGGKLSVQTNNPHTFIVQPSPYVSPGSFTVEGDWSAAGAFIVLSALTGGRISYANLDPHSLQGDRSIVDGIKMLSQPGDFEADCTDLPDQVMNLALFCAYRSGSTRILGAKNLRLKECDRLKVITQELSKTGIDIKEEEDGLFIRGRRPKLAKSTILDPHDDHRMAMCFGILGSLISGISINNPACVSKSYPHFFEDLASLHHATRPVAVIGMRGAGKSNLARRVASRLKLQFIDTDKEVERMHGKISDLVAAQGWPKFRELEAQAIETSLKPGAVIALGGGAIETERVRQMLREKAIVIWMHMTPRGTAERLKITRRPALTSLPLDEEVKMLHEKRDPLYGELAHIIVPEHMPFARQHLFVEKELQLLLRSYDIAKKAYTHPPAKI